MDFRIRIEGEEPGMIMHAWQPAPLLTDAQEDERGLIIRKTDSKRSDDERRALAEYDTIRSLWVDRDGQPTIPASVIRTVLEGGARRTKEGGEVRSNIIVTATTFEYDPALGSTPAEWGHNLRFDAGVKVGQSRVNRSRALFPPPWSCDAILDVAEMEEAERTAVDADQIMRWMRAAGRTLGIGDWRPAKSGVYGRFRVVEGDWVS